MIEYVDMSRKGNFLDYLSSLGLKVGVEVGVQQGLFSECLCKHGFKMYSVDSWIHDAEYEVIAREKLGKLDCTIIKDWSVNAAKQFKDESVDFVYIDASHDEKNCREDIEAWDPKVRKGGVVSGHDFSDEDAAWGVIEAVTKWTDKNNISPIYVLNETVGNPSWFYIKK
jgi:predicted O-methyltransferase YrrM